MNERLFEMLRYKRPHESESEAQFVEDFLNSYSPVNLVNAGYLIEVPHPDGELSTTLFSSHVDTVHKAAGLQSVFYNAKTGIISKKDGEPLGADDGAGVWLMLEMIDAKVPGAYLFHRGEECGGLGSKALASSRSSWLKEFERAIAFDRRGSSDVITHQAFKRCCSDLFAQALSDELNQDPRNIYAPNDGGIFTDTANYTHLIPECTNIACGYDNEHTGAETLHLPSLLALRDACIKIKWDSLPTIRDPKEPDPDAYYNGYGYEYRDHSRDLYTMTLTQMEDFAYTDPENFAGLVYELIRGGEIVENDDHYFDEMRGLA